MGYILLLVIGGVVLVGLFVAFVGGKKRPAGRTAPAHDITYKEPSSEQDVTPGASTTASQTEAEAARKRIPPA